MIPSLAVVRVRSRRGRGIHLWIPLVLVWILLLPIAVLILPLFFLFCLVGRVHIARAMNVFQSLFRGLKGMQFEVENRVCSVSLRIA
jgi:hypothetical protein